MRFEWLFIGYVFMFQITVGNITLLPLLAYLIMLFAMVRLAKFENAFKKAMYALLVAVPIGAALLGLQICKTALPELASGVAFTYAYNAVRILSECAEMVIMFFVYVGVKIIGANTEIKSLEKHSSRNMAVMLVYFVFEMLMSFISIFAPSLFDGYEVIKLYPFIIGFIWRVLNLWMIITCYLGVSVKDPSAAAAEAETSEKPSFPQKKKKKKHRKNK
jgi:hypothetical protein